MVIIEIIGEIIIRIVVEILFEGVIVGIYRLFKKGIEFVRVQIFGLKPKPVDKIKAIEKRLLYKKIKLTENLNSQLKVGQKGAILEVIDEKYVFAEFYDRNGKQIELENELVFKVEIKQFIIQK
jgi:hypothetical protein